MGRSKREENRHGQKLERGKQTRVEARERKTDTGRSKREENRHG